jgi:hypothetical protein
MNRERIAIAAKQNEESEFWKSEQVTKRAGQKRASKAG